MSNYRGWDTIGMIAGAVAGLAGLALWYRHRTRAAQAPAQLEAPELDEAVQCEGYTQDGHRCKRVTTHSSRRCYLHR